MTKLNCAILDDYQGVALEYADWGSLSDKVDVTVFREYLGNEAAVAAALKGFEIVCIMRERTPFPASLIRALPDMKLLITTGMYNQSVDMEAARECGVTVSGTKSLGRSTSELAWALILTVSRHIAFEDRAMRQGGWQTTIGPGLHGRTLGVIGLGRLGDQVAQVGKAFGMNVQAWSQNLTEDRCREAGFTYTSLDELLQTSDFVTIHLKLSDRTRGLLGARELGLMRRESYLINTSRGPIIDEAAMIDALRDRRIAGAGLDVYDVEPLPKDHILRTLDNAVLSPHLGYVAEENYRVFYSSMVTNISSWLDGAPENVIA